MMDDEWILKVVFIVSMVVLVALTIILAVSEWAW